MTDAKNYFNIYLLNNKISSWMTSNYRRKTHSYFEKGMVLII